MDDVGCLGQRQAGSGGFQGQDAEGRAGFLLEGGDDVLAFRNRRSPVQGKPGTAEDSGQEIVQMGNDGAELGKENGFFLPGGNGGAQFLKPPELSGALMRIIVRALELGGVVADLLEACQNG